MIISLPGRRAISALAAVTVCAAVLAVGSDWYGSRGPGAEVVAETVTPSGWKTIEHDGVLVDVPAAWQRLEMDECEFQFERWGPPGTSSCRAESGVSFYGSATFDPAHGPGVRRVDSTDEPPWGGYAYAGDFAVYASDGERSIVKRVLRSAADEEGDS